MYSLDADARLTFLDGSSKRARIVVTSLLRGIVAQREGELIDLAEVAETQLPAAVFYSRMDAATSAIVVDWLDHPGFLVPLDHRRELGTAFASWADELVTDYVVFYKFIGAYETDDQRTMNMLAPLYHGTVVTGRRVGVAALVDLHRCRIVRVEGRQFDNLTDPMAARAILVELTQSLLR